MKCFNHPDREAVATCQKCGKGLCRECAEKYTPCLCDSCADQIQRNRQQQAQAQEDSRKAKYKAALVDTRSEFIKTALIGVALAVFAVVFMMTRNAGTPLSYYLKLLVLGFCVPFGWKFLTYLQSFFPVWIIGSFGFWFCYLVFKVFFSTIVGVPAMIYQVIKTVSAQNKIKKMK